MSRSYAFPPRTSPFGDLNTNLSLDRFPVREGLPDLFTQAQVRVRTAIIDDGVKLFHIDHALFVQDALIGTDVDDLTDADAVLVEFDQSGLFLRMAGRYSAANQVSISYVRVGVSDIAVMTAYTLRSRRRHARYGRASFSGI